jgi:hypothetical protein
MQKRPMAAMNPIKIADGDGRPLFHQARTIRWKRGPAKLNPAFLDRRPLGR